MPRRRSLEINQNLRENSTDALSKEFGRNLSPSKICT